MDHLERYQRHVETFLELLAQQNWPAVEQFLTKRLDGLVGAPREAQRHFLQNDTPFCATQLATRGQDEILASFLGRLKQTIHPSQTPLVFDCLHNSFLASFHYDKPRSFDVLLSFLTSNPQWGDQWSDLFFDMIGVKTLGASKSLDQKETMIGLMAKQAPDAVTLGSTLYRAMKKNEIRLTPLTMLGAISPEDQLIKFWRVAAKEFTEHQRRSFLDVVIKQLDMPQHNGQMVLARAVSVFDPWLDQTELDLVRAVYQQRGWKAPSSAPRMVAWMDRQDLVGRAGLDDQLDGKIGSGRKI